MALTEASIEASRQQVFHTPNIAFYACVKQMLGAVIVMTLWAFRLEGDFL